ncbi:MAG: pilus assembly protein PilP [Gammaproteobacteria bacterium]
MNAVRTRRLFFYPALLVLVALGSGCVSRDMTDLENSVSEVLARKGGKIEPLPPIKPYERYLYQSGELGLRDPFETFAQAAKDVEQVEAITDAKQQEYANEILTHNREELETHELDALRMVGVLEDTDDLWGIVRDPDGVVHRVQVGNYVGRNFGKIINIQEDRIDIREIIRDAQGRYEERQASLALAEQ